MFDFIILFKENTLCSGTRYSGEMVDSLSLRGLAAESPKTSQSHLQEKRDSAVKPRNDSGDGTVRNMQLGVSPRLDRGVPYTHNRIC